MTEWTGGGQELTGDMRKVSWAMMRRGWWMVGAALTWVRPGRDPRDDKGPAIWEKAL